MPLPSRVIEISDDSIRLMETNGQCGQYIALSHCWGDSRPLCLTTKATIDDNKLEIAGPSLPKTFQNTVQVCRELGIRYLWIDSICIIQDDKIDWMQESAKMAPVYHDSYLTICATSARSDDDGLWPSSLERAPIKKVIIQRQSQDFIIYARLKDDLRAVHPEGKFNDKVRPIRDALSPLMTRAWTFQERLISPRLLHFGYGELLWQCPELQTCECCANEESSKSWYMRSCEHERGLLRRALRGENDSMAASSWRWFVQDYSGLQLTFEKDALVALSGVAKMCLKKRPGDRYLAGLWERSLIADLTWIPVSPLSNTDLRRRPASFRAPSWSWALIRRQVIFIHVTDDIDRICARILRATSVPSGIDPTGEVASGSIVLVAPVEPARITRVIAESFYVYSPHADHDVMFKFDSTAEIDDQTISEGKPILCLRLQYNAKRPGLSSIMLALVPVDNRPGVYRRVGIIRVSRRQDFGDASFNQEIEVEII
ncbi:hypothetical protein IFR05_010247 [Cadophora sp. M221]|nr:hypothetical protein IFR05_010247 [Cadophora sp. M221]